MAPFASSWRPLAFSKTKHLPLVLAGGSRLLSSCLNPGPATRPAATQALAGPMQTARFELLDSSRQRLVPVIAYFPAAASAA